MYSINANVLTFTDSDADIILGKFIKTYCSIIRKQTMSVEEELDEKELDLSVDKRSSRKRKSIVIPIIGGSMFITNPIFNRYAGFYIKDLEKLFGKKNYDLCTFIYKNIHYINMVLDIKKMSVLIKYIKEFNGVKKLVMDYNTNLISIEYNTGYFTEFPLFDYKYLKSSQILEDKIDMVDNSAKAIYTLIENYDITDCKKWSHAILKINKITKETLLLPPTTTIEENSEFYNYVKLDMSIFAIGTKTNLLTIYYIDNKNPNSDTTYLKCLFNGTDVVMHIVVAVLII